MTQQPQEAPAKKRKFKDYKAINGACKMAKLSDGLTAKPCVKCDLVHKLRECPFCHTKRGKK